MPISDITRDQNCHLDAKDFAETYLSVRVTVETIENFRVGVTKNFQLDVFENLHLFVFCYSRITNS